MLKLDLGEGRGAIIVHVSWVKLYTSAERKVI
jgi:hypothetical protein